MPIIAKDSGSNFIPAPAGPALAVCCDVVDLGLVTGKFGTKPEIKIVWQLADVDDQIQKRPIVQKRYTLSLHEKANLRKDLESWRGRPFTTEELKGFDVEKVIGVPVFLNIVHNTKDGTTYANAAAVMPPPKSSPAVAVEGYIRVKDRTQKEQAETADYDDSEGSPF